MKRLPRRIEGSSILASILLASGLVACDAGFLPRGKSVMSQAIDPLGRSKVTTTDPALRSAVQVQTLAIGREMITEMKDNLADLGLTDDQKDYIAQATEHELVQQVGQLAISSSFGLDDTGQPSAVMLASPLVVQGAFKSLADPALGLSDATSRAQVAQGVVGSSFKSLNGRTGDLSSDNIQSLAQNMTATAFQNLSAAGLSQGDALTASRLITEGAVGSLKAAGIEDSAVSAVASAVVQGAVASMQAVDIDAKDTASLLGNMTQGAVSGASQVAANSSDGLTLAGTLASTSIVSLAALKLSNDLVVASVKGISQGAVGAMADLYKADPTSSLGSAVEHITGAMVSSLGSTNFDTKTLQSSSGSIAGGAVAGVVGGGIADADIAASGVMKSVVKGTLGAMAKTGLSTSDIASSMGPIVGGAIAGLGAASVSDSLRNTTITSVISSTMSSMSKAGVKDSSQIEVAVSGLSKGATQALTSAGVAASDLAAKAALIVRTSISNVGATGVATTSALTSVAAQITQGVMAGIGDMSKKNSGLIASSASAISTAVVQGVAHLVSASNVQVSGVVDLTTNITGGMMQGLALAGIKASTITSVGSSVRSTVVAGMQSANMGLSTSDINQLDAGIATNTTSAATLAGQVTSGSIVQCSSVYPDSLTDSQFSAALGGQTFVLCTASSAQICPKKRNISGYLIEWFPGIVDTSLCNMHRSVNSTTSVAGTSTSPVAVIAAAPNAGSLIGNVAGTGVDYYRYKIGAQATVGCALSTGYSAATPASTPLAIDISSYAPSTTIALCVVGGNALGVWQDYGKASVSTWTIGSVAPPPPPPARLDLAMCMTNIFDMARDTTSGGVYIVGETDNNLYSAGTRPVTAYVNFTDPSKNWCHTTEPRYLKVLVNSVGQYYLFGTGYNSTGMLGLKFAKYSSPAATTASWESGFTPALGYGYNLSGAGLLQDGNPVIVGYANNMYSASSGSDGFVFKIDAGTGNLAYQVPFDANTENSEQPYGLSVDSLGNIWVAGTSYDSAAGRQNMRLVKYNASLGRVSDFLYTGGTGVNGVQGVIADLALNAVHVHQRVYDGAGYPFARVTTYHLDTATWADQNLSDGTGYVDQRAFVMDDNHNLYAGFMDQASAGNTFKLTKLPMDGSLAWSHTLAGAPGSPYYDLKAASLGPTGDILAAAVYRGTSMSQTYHAEIRALLAASISAGGDLDASFASAGVLTLPQLLKYRYTRELRTIVQDNLGHIYSAGFDSSGGNFTMWVEKLSAPVIGLVGSVVYHAADLPGTGHNVLDIALDSTGQTVYVLGSSNDVNFAGSGSEWWVKKFDANLYEDTSWHLAVNMGTSGTAARSLAVDSGGNVYVVGIVNGYDAATSNSTSAVVMKKFDSSGNEVLVGGWPLSVDAAEYPSYTDVTDFALDSYGSAYVLGRDASSQWWLKKFNLADGSNANYLMSIQPADIAGYYLNPASIACDTAGDVYISGYRTTNDPITGVYTYPWWLLKFDGTGANLTGTWASINHGDSTSSSYGFPKLMIDSSNRVYLFGGPSGSAAPESFRHNPDTSLDSSWILSNF